MTLMMMMMMMMMMMIIIIIIIIIMIIIIIIIIIIMENVLFDIGYIMEPGNHFCNLNIFRRLRKIAKSDN